MPNNPNLYMCKLCGKTNIHRTHIVREMFFGTRETFSYYECESCGSLQISSTPSDLKRFYPQDYYSYLPTIKPNAASRVRDWLRRQRTSYTLTGRNIIGGMIQLVGRNDYFDYPWEWFRSTGVNLNSKILDIGCGNGKLLLSLREQGFRKLIGIDPFRMKSEFFNNVTLLKAFIFEINDSYDLVMAHHSLEHMPEPMEALAQMRDISKPGGFILVRIPVLGQSWMKYGVNWVELDAPRHLFLASISGFTDLITRIGGLKLEKILFDGISFEIAGSELYMRDIPLFPQELKGATNIDRHFSKDEIENFEKAVQKLNAQRTAGRAAFFIRVT